MAQNGALWRTLNDPAARSHACVGGVEEWREEDSAGHESPKGCRAP